MYAQEGSVAVGGSLIQWLRDQLGILSTAAESETLASQVEDSGSGDRPGVFGPVRAQVAP